MEKFTKELVNLDGVNLSKPCEGELPRYAILSQSGKGGDTTDAEQALINAIGENQYGHIEFVGTDEVLGRMIEIEGELHIAVMRGDQLYVNEISPLAQLMLAAKQISIADLADNFGDVVSNHVDRHVIMDTLRSIDTDSAREELAEHEQCKSDIRSVPRNEESAQVIWDAWAKGIAIYFTGIEFNPEKVRARHIKETVPAPQEIH